MISGKVRGGAGALVRLTHSDGFAYESIARTNGVYRFIDLPAGRYSLEVINPAGSRVDAIDLPPAQEVAYDLSAYGWGFEIDQRPRGAWSHVDLQRRATAQFDDCQWPNGWSRRRADRHAGPAHQRRRTEELGHPPCAQRTGAPRRGRDGPLRSGAAARRQLQAGGTGLAGQWRRLRAAGRAVELPGPPSPAAW